MTGSALAMGVLGLLGSFVPDQVLGWLGVPDSPALLLLVQVMGALYLGWAVLNWTARYGLIGGIYNRPVVLGNLLHFLSAGLAMMKLLWRAPDLRVLWPLALVYALFAACFATLLFRHPLRSAPGETAASSGP